MSFLFKCCKSDSSAEKYYQVQTRDGNNIKTEYYANISDIKDLKHADRILKVNKSGYDELIKKYEGQNKWTDPTFPPGSKSLGTINNVPSDCQWKRISEIIENPKLFVDHIHPTDVIQGSLGDCYFLSAVAALAQKQGRIPKVFGNQEFNPTGIYRITLRIDGIIQQILVDDYVPINKANKPLFCQPNKNQFWVVLLEKAWAKAHGSYANINSGTPSQVFKAVTYAPSQLRPIKNQLQHINKLWKDILECSRKDDPLCCGTSNNSQIDWNKIGLTPGHAYSLIDANQFVDESEETHRMVKLRNPWGFHEWNGDGCQNDHSFWSRIPNTATKQKFLDSSKFGNDGIFFMKYQDLCKHFSEVHFCYLLDNAVYEQEQMHVDGKHGSLFTLNVREQNDYIIQLHQNGIRGQTNVRLKQGLNRSTLLLAKGSNFQFMDGSLKYQEQDNSLKASLTPGQYYIYAKIDPTLSNKLIPESVSVSCYSNNYADIKAINKKQHADFFKQVFLSYARNNRRKQFNDNLMWISWKLLFQKGGFAFLAFGVHAQSVNKFVVTVNQADFIDLGFTLKKPHKGKGKQVLQIKPGQQQIIVARVKNAPLKPMKFPPPMDIQIDKAA